MSRATTAIVSAATRDYVHNVVLYPRESRRLTANFRAILGPGETIAQADWQLEVMGYAGIADGSISGALTSVRLLAAVAGLTIARCQITTSAGNVYPQLFRVEVLMGPWLNDPPPLQGSTRVIVNA